jgi:F0F1-type ATP synthase assembly protein I
MGITVAWSRLGLGAIVGFLIGWLIFGLLGAVVLALIIMVLMGIIKISPPIVERQAQH